MPIAGWRPDMAIQIAFNADPNDPAAIPAWTSFTGQGVSADQISRGADYELDRPMPGAPTITFRDPDETLNPANNAAVTCYRQILWQAVWPNPASGNLINTGGWRPNDYVPYDSTFDSYALGSLPWWLAAFGGTAPFIDNGFPFQGTNDVTATLVAGTTQQGVAFLVPCIPGRQYTASCYVRTNPANTIRIDLNGGATGSSISANSTYNRISVTFTATQPQHAINVHTTGTAVAGNLRIDAFQHEQAATASAFTTTGSVIYPVLLNLVEQFPRIWANNGFEGFAPLPCVDALAALSGNTIGTDWYNALTRQYQPDNYWPLSASTASGLFTTASSVFQPGPSAQSTPPLTQLISKYGGAYIGVGNSLNIVGDPGGTGATFQRDIVPPQNAGTILQAGGPGSSFAFPAGNISGGFSVTMACWVSAGAVTPADSQVLITPLNHSGSYTQPPGIYIDANGHLAVASGGTYDGSSNPVVAAGGPVITDGKPHFCVGVATTDTVNTTVTAFVDGLAVASASAANSTIGGTLTATGNTLLVGGFFAFTTYQQIVNGSMAHVCLWNVALTPTQIFDLWHAGGGYAGILAGNRVRQHLLTYGNFTGATRINAGSTVMGPPSYSGSIDLLTDTLDTMSAEGGHLWQAPDGALVFEGRNQRWLRTTPQYVLGDNPPGGEIPYDGSIRYGYDPFYVYPNVQISRSGGSTATGGTAADIATARKRYFNRSYTNSVDALYDQNAQDQANYIFYTHNNPLQRIDQIIIDPSSNPALWPFCLSVEIGQRLTVIRRPKAANGGTGLTMSADFFVEKIVHSAISSDDGTWLTTLTVSPIGSAASGTTMQPWILGDPVYGILGSTTYLGY